VRQFLEQIRSAGYAPLRTENNCRVYGCEYLDRLQSLDRGGRDDGEDDGGGSEGRGVRDLRHRRAETGAQKPRTSSTV